MKALLAGLSAIALFAMPAAHADEDDHFEGLPSETLQEAVSNLDAYTALLETALAGEVDQEAMMDIHELSYTLENAVQRLSAEIEALAEALEEVHLASEQWDDETVKAQGEVFTSGVRTILPR
ncbi:hypothetical protein FKB34_08060 [Glycocaulis profundi]|nr:hypothetical protein FKB34_08060 [Glycocaulis profundi]